MTVHRISGKLSPDPLENPPGNPPDARHHSNNLFRSNDHLAKLIRIAGKHNTDKYFVPTTAKVADLNPKATRSRPPTANQTPGFLRPSACTVNTTQPNDWRSGELKNDYRWFSEERRSMSYEASTNRSCQLVWNGLLK